MKGSFVWIFNGANASFPAGVFPTREEARAWIRENRLTGTLTQYPLGVGVYDWAVEQGFFKPKRSEQTLPRFIQGFTSQAQAHEHFEGGE